MLESGHRWPDIKDYTLNQVGLFVKEAATRSKARQLDSIRATWIGTHGKKSYIEGLEKQHKPKSKVANDPKEVKKEWIRLAQAVKGWK